MTEQEIIDNAPDGETHYWVSYKTWNTYYFKAVGRKLFLWNHIKQWYSETDFSLLIKPL